MTEKIINIILQILGFIIIPVFAGGIIRKIRARAQGRKGPPLLQNLYDFQRLFQKRPVDGPYSGIFCENAPAFSLLASLLVWASVLFGWPVMLSIPFFLALQRIAMTGYAMETGTSFGGLGTSREILLYVSAEPVIIMIILVGQSKLNLDFSMESVIVGVLFISAGLVAVLAELARPPFDDPRTHLELTMVHEAMLLEASGRRLALFDAAYQIKIAALLYLLVKLALDHSKLPFAENLPVYAYTLAGFAGTVFLSTVTGYWESSSIRRRWDWVPEIMGLTFLFLLILGTLVKIK